MNWLIGFHAGSATLRDGCLPLGGTAPWFLRPKFQSGGSNGMPVCYKEIAWIGILRTIQRA
jgi:hypothetical protein